MDEGWSRHSFEVGGGFFKGGPEGVTPESLGQLTRTLSNERAALVSSATSCLVLTKTRSRLAQIAMYTSVTTM
eukprot:scaffold189126_cov34-Prasinocladus_malaysianus.AAC.1